MAEDLTAPEPTMNLPLKQFPTRLYAALLPVAEKHKTTVAALVTEIIRLQVDGPRPPRPPQEERVPESPAMKRARVNASRERNRTAGLRPEDRDEMRRLYDLNCSDSEIEARTGISRRTVLSWRHAEGLPSFYGSWGHKEVRDDPQRSGMVAAS